MDIYKHEMWTDACDLDKRSYNITGGTSCNVTLPLLSTILFKYLNTVRYIEIIKCDRTFIIFIKIYISNKCCSCELSVDQSIMFHGFHNNNM